jgi:hypothetical protein
VERALFTAQWQSMSEPQRRAWRERHGSERGARIAPAIRIIDSRGGAAPSLAYDAPVTIIEKMEEWTPTEEGVIDHAQKDLAPLIFTPSSRSLTTEGGTGEINDGVELVNDLLYYDATRATESAGIMEFHGQPPRLYFSADVEWLITAMEMWTGADGGKGACKDQVDLVRYLAQHGLQFIPENQRRSGGYF